METKCTLQLNEKDASHAQMGLICGDSGVFSDGFGEKLSDLIAQATVGPIKCAMGDVKHIYDAMWAYRISQGVPERKALKDLE